MSCTTIVKLAELFLYTFRIGSNNRALSNFDLSIFKKAISVYTATLQHIMIASFFGYTHSIRMTVTLVGNVMCASV